MKFIIDQQLPPVLAEWLREEGLDARHVREFGMTSAPDAEIWEGAKGDGFCVVTKGEDFVKLWRTKEQGAVLWVRNGNCNNQALVELFERRWPSVLARLRLGDRFLELR